MAIFITGTEDPFLPHKDFKILITGTEVMNRLPLVATAYTMFSELIYTFKLFKRSATQL